MEDFVKGLAASEGWTDQTLIHVLSTVLEDLVTMGAADRLDLEAMLRRRGEVDSHEDELGPLEDDIATMHGQDAEIIITYVPDCQPRAAEGVWEIHDQYGNHHQVERDDADDGWKIIIPAV